MRYNQKDANVLIDLARKTIIKKKEQEYSNNLENYKEKRGAFVTLNKDSNLRGCIGYILPYFPLWQAVTKAAYAAAYEDPRFNPVQQDEFDYLEIELSILTIPKIIEVNDPEGYFNKIEIGKHGLILESSYGSGVLLPQVPLEWNWDIKEFLENLSMKAGLDRNAWKEKDTKIYSFTAQVFKEKKE